MKNYFKNILELKRIWYLSLNCSLSIKRPFSCALNIKCEIGTINAVYSVLSFHNSIQIIYKVWMILNCILREHKWLKKICIAKNFKCIFLFYTLDIFDIYFCILICQSNLHIRVLNNMYVIVFIVGIYSMS